MVERLAHVWLTIVGDDNEGIAILFAVNLNRDCVAGPESREDWLNVGLGRFNDYCNALLRGKGGLGDVNAGEVGRQVCLSPSLREHEDISRRSVY